MNKYVLMPIKAALIRIRETGDYAHVHYLDGYTQALLLSDQLTSAQSKMCCTLIDNALHYGKLEADKKRKGEKG